MNQKMFCIWVKKRELVTNICHNSPIKWTTISTQKWAIPFLLLYYTVYFESRPNKAPFALSLFVCIFAFYPTCTSTQTHKKTQTHILTHTHTHTHAHTKEPKNFSFFIISCIQTWAIGFRILYYKKTDVITSLIIHSYRWRLLTKR